MDTITQERFIELVWSDGLCPECGDLSPLDGGVWNGECRRCFWQLEENGYE